MRRLTHLLALVTTAFTFVNYPLFPAPLDDQPFKSSMDAFKGQVNVQLNDPVYRDGMMITEKGGIATAQDLYIQAKNIAYIRRGPSKGSSGTSEHKLQASEMLYMVYEGKSYKGSKVEIDFTSGIIRIWDGCTKNGDWFVGGKEIEIRPDGNMYVKNAYLSTSENQRNDWSIEATTLTVLKGDSIKAHNVSFNFEKLPLFWLPSYSRSLKEGQGESAPFKYRMRWGGSQGFRIGLTYQLGTFGRWTHKAIADYNFKYGIGAGLLSIYDGPSSNERFEMLNYVAQGSRKSFNPKNLRYRFQGFYRNYFEESNINMVAMYDKLSDKGMKSEFSDHALSDARPALTQATLWRKESDWVAQMNTRVRINNFQTVKQELPLFTFNIRPHSLGNSRWMIDNRFSAGYLDYVYNKSTHKVKDFSSTRSEVSQRLFTTFNPAPFTISPYIGYRAIHYSSSPQHRQRMQMMAEMGALAKTRLIKFSPYGFQSIEPYLSYKSIIHPTVKPDRNYIFDLEDGWNSLHESRIGLQHTFIRSPSSSGFQQKICTDIFTRYFFSSSKIGSHPTKLWLNSVFNATPTVAYKLMSAYDFRHKTTDHFNIQMRKTFSRTVAMTLEYRQRSKYAWRKIDPDNFIIDVTRSKQSLEKSEMSDERRAVLASIFWQAAPNLDIELTTARGWRKISDKGYYDMDLSIATIVRGALHIKLSYGRRSGGVQKWYISLGLGAKKGSSSTGFRKIGEGNYDIW